MKKIIFYFLTALVVLIFKVDSSYSIPTIPKYDENYWTLEKMKQAKPLTARNIGFKTRRGVENIKNRGAHKDRRPSQPPVGVPGRAIAIGKLFMSRHGEDFSCTASVINTHGGNIAVTAAHCLYDHDSESYYNNVMFSPGYDNGQVGPLGRIPVDRMIVTEEFFDDNNEEYNWGMMTFNFDVDGHPLKYFTGALGWQFLNENRVPTTFRGYPEGGNLENCPNDGEVLCTWEGETMLEDDFYIVQDLHIGNGAAGGPLMVDYNPEMNLGLLYSNYISFDEFNDQLLATIYDPDEFHDLIDELGDR